MHCKHRNYSDSGLTNKSSSSTLFFSYLLPFWEFHVRFSRNGGARYNYYKLIQALGDFVQMMLESQPYLAIGNKSFVNVLLVYY